MSSPYKNKIRRVADSKTYAYFIGQETKRLRKKFKLSEQSMGLLVGTTSGRMRKIEQGEILLSDYEFVRLCHVFGKYPHDFLYPSDPREGADDFSFPDAENPVNFYKLIDFFQAFQKIKDPESRDFLLDVMERLGSP